MNRFLSLLMTLVFGVAVLGFGCYLTFFENRGFVATTAVIDHIDQTETGVDDSGDPEYSYDVYVNYTVDGKDYSGSTGYYNEGYEAGKEITIYYDPENPQRMHGDSGNFGIYMMAAGVIFTLFSAISWLRSIA